MKKLLTNKYIFIVPFFIFLFFAQADSALAQRENVSRGDWLSMSGPKSCDQYSSIGNPNKCCARTHYGVIYGTHPFGGPYINYPGTNYTRVTETVSNSYCPAPPPPPPSGSCWVSASPNQTSGPNGQNVTISWGSSGDVTRLTGNYGDGTLNGSRTYRLKSANIGVTGYASDGTRLCSDSAYVTYTAPPPPKQCADGIDNDGDGDIDSQDLGCSGNSDDDEYNAPVVCSVTASPTQVAYGEDMTFTWSVSGLGAASVRIMGVSSNDLNGSITQSMRNSGYWTTNLSVYDDTNARGDIVCTATSNSFRVNPPPRQCNDGIDNDGDGDIDYPADSGCSSSSDDDEQGSAPNPAISASDTDIFENEATQVSWNPNGHTGQCTVNEGVGVVTATGNRVFSPSANTTYTISCSDTQNDYADPYTISDSVLVTVNPLPQCSDGVNNSDGDNFIDYPDDPGCSSASDDDESNAVTQCNDGFDNDSDGAMDFSGGDAGCVDASDDDESDVVTPPSTPPEISITASSPLIRSGETVSVEWDPNGFVGTCTLSPALKFTGADTSVNESRDITLSAKQTIIYECTGNYGGVVTVQATTTINVLPKIFES